MFLFSLKISDLVVEYLKNCSDSSLIKLFVVMFRPSQHLVKFRERLRSGLLGKTSTLTSVLLLENFF